MHATVQKQPAHVVEAFLMTFGRQEGRVELCPRTHVLAGVYAAHVLDYAPATGFRKFGRGWAHGTWHRGGQKQPLAEDILKFRRDAAIAAASEPAIAAYISRCVEMRL